MVHHLRLAPLILAASLVLAPGEARAFPEEPIATPDVLASMRRAFPSPPEGRNAAIAYLQVFHTYWASDLTEAARAIKYVPTPDAAAARIPPEGLEAAAPLLVKSGFTLDHLHEAAKRDRYDMDLDRALGFELLLPHHTPMRDAARRLRADARRAALDGDGATAVRRIWTMLRISKHLQSELLTVSSMSAMFAATAALDELDTLRLLAPLTPDQRQLLASAVRDLTSDDPFRIRAGAALETRVLATMLRAYTGPDAGRRLNEWAVNVGLERIDDRLDTMDGQALAREADRVEAFGEAHTAALASPDAPAQTAALSERIKAGEFGVCKRLLSAYTTAVQQRAEAVAKIDAALTWLEAVEQP